MPGLPELDPLVHGQMRLAALSILSAVDEAEFTFIRDRIGATDGNLSVHLSKLADAAYIQVMKRFVNNKPRTYYRLTEKGRTAFLRYVAELKSLLRLGAQTSD